jgi:tetratricopeptide (TPR) repeat protein
MAYTELKKPDLAIADMTMCIKLAPEKGSHYQWRAFAYEQKQQWNEALADLNKAVALCDPAHKNQFLSHRAEVYVKLNRLKDAINDYDTLLKANSMDDAFWLKRGDCCMALGNYKEAVKSYSETISLDDSSTAYFARSKAYAKLGQNDLAVKDKVAGDHLLQQKAINPI